MFPLPPSEQITRSKALLEEHPTKDLKMLFKATVKGKRKSCILARVCVDTVAGEGEGEKSRGTVVITFLLVLIVDLERWVRFLLPKGDYADDPEDSMGPEVVWKGDHLDSFAKTSGQRRYPDSRNIWLLSVSPTALVILNAALQTSPASKGHTNIVALLLDTGFNLPNEDAVLPLGSNVSNIANYTDIINNALIDAAESDAVSTIKLILDKYGAAGANVNFAQTPHNASASYGAAGNGRTDAVQYLIKTYQH